MPPGDDERAASPALLREGRGVFSYRPGEPLANYMLHFDHAPGSGHDEKFELVSSAYRLRKSRCFLASGGALTCTTCHDPHKTARGEEAARHYAQACLQCHSGKLAKLVQDQRHPAGEKCAECHMPQRRPSDAVHIVITDHYISARPTLSSAPVIEEHSGNTAPYSGEVALYYPRALPATAENELDLAIAQVKQQANLRAGLSRLERAIERYRPERSEPYFEMAEAIGAQAGPKRQSLTYGQAEAANPPAGTTFPRWGLRWLPPASRRARSKRWTAH